jgi:hypothetical protein
LNENFKRDQIFDLIMKVVAKNQYIKHSSLARAVDAVMAIDN